MGAFFAETRIAKVTKIRERREEEGIRERGRERQEEEEEGEDTEVTYLHQDNSSRRF